jgi:CheY-like chemotaxis protein
MAQHDSSPAVLVVEDEAVIRIDVAMSIEDAGFKVYEAESADRAISLLEDCPDIGVLFTDVNMPGAMDGLALSHVARRRWRGLAIILTSGRRPIAAAELPEEAHFLGKPYRLADLIASLRKIR